MTRLEDELRNVLNRRQPPAGFAEPVMPGAVASGPGSWFKVFMQHHRRWAIAGAICLVLAAVGIRYREYYHHQTRGQEAKAQLMHALRITADKLQFAQIKVQQHGIQ